MNPITLAPQSVYAAVGSVNMELDRLLSYTTASLVGHEQAAPDNCVALALTAFGYC